MKVEIWSDLMCPFCYIGKRKFEQALSQFPEKNNIEIEWKSFELDPDFKPVKGQDIHTMLAEKKGWTRDYAKQMNDHVLQMAKEAGLDYDFDGMIPSNTFNAHRFSHLAAQHGVQDVAEEKLFAAHFIEGKDIDDAEVLKAIGKEIGINESEVDAMLSSDKYVQDVRNDELEAQQIGARGVPFFVIDRKYAVSGAQPAEVFLNALTTAWNEHKPSKLTDMSGDGEACNVDGSNC